MLNTLTIAIPAPPKLERWVAEMRPRDKLRSAEVVGPAAKPRGNEEESQDSKVYREDDDEGEFWSFWGSACIFDG
jgi:hypothetical protein